MCVCVSEGRVCVCEKKKKKKKKILNNLKKKLLVVMAHFLQEWVSEKQKYWVFDDMHVCVCINIYIYMCVYEDTVCVKSKDKEQE